MTRMNDGKYKYYAFISYKREDERWAKWLQNRLMRYKLPIGVRRLRPELPENVHPIFRDTTDLCGGILAEALGNALDSSRYLIVICSPQAAKSLWVCHEVERFISSGREKYIIPFIVEGTPNSADDATECFPEALRRLSGESELLGININEMGRDAAAIKVVARMFDLQFDTLWQRWERDRRRRRWLTALGIFVAIAAIVVAGFVFAHKSAELRDARLEKEVAHRLHVSNIAQQLVAENDAYTAVRILLDVMPEDAQQAALVVPQETVAVLREAARCAVTTFRGDFRCEDVAFSADGRYVVISHGGGEVTLWSVRDGSVSTTTDGAVTCATPTTTSADGAYSLSFHDGDIITLKDAVSGEPLGELYDDDMLVEAATFSPDGRYVASVSYAGVARLWSVEQALREDRLSLGYRGVSSVAYSPDERCIAVATKEGAVHILDAESMAEVVALEVDMGVLTSVAFSPDGRYILVAASDAKVSLWSVDSGAIVGVVGEHEDVVTSVAYSTDGRYIATATAKGDIAVWNAVTGDAVHNLEVEDAWVESIAFSPDGEEIVAAMRDGRVLLWRVGHDEALHLLECDGPANSVAFSHDGRYLVSASRSRVVVCCVESGAVEMEMDARRELITTVTFTSDSGAILAATDGGMVYRWIFKPFGELLNEARERFKDNPLSDEERRKYYLE